MALNEHHYQRIDKGTKRDYRALARRQPRTSKGTFGLLHSPEKRQAAIQDALNSLPAGESTDLIAARHNIPGSTLRAWILADETLDSQANSARRVFLSHELSLRAKDIDTAQDPLALARAREAFRAWSWIAERRESRIFGPKQETRLAVEFDLGDRLRRAEERILDKSLVSGDKGLTIEHTDVMSSPLALPSPSVDISKDVSTNSPQPAEGPIQSEPKPEGE